MTARPKPRRIPNPVVVWSQVDGRWHRVLAGSQLSPMTAAARKRQQVGRRYRPSARFAVSWEVPLDPITRRCGRCGR